MGALLLLHSSSSIPKWVSVLAGAACSCAVPAPTSMQTPPPPEPLAHPHTHPWLTHGSHAGVLLLGNIQLQAHLNEHANFQTFPNAMLLLFRVATGDDWAGIMSVGVGAARRCAC